jgi:hypothetical protein
MTLRPAFSELRWPDDSESFALAERWATDVAERVLDWTWRGFDRFRRQHLSLVDLTRPLEEIERDIASKHFIAINQVWATETGGCCSISPIHEWPELASRPQPPGRSPACDFAFVSVQNQRIAWPIEAKVIETPRRLAQYKIDLRKFMSGTAAPFVGEGGMIGYLRAGGSDEFFVALETLLHQKLGFVDFFSDRPHRTSHHRRARAPALRLHHMVMELTGQGPS